MRVKSFTHEFPITGSINGCMYDRWSRTHVPQVSVWEPLSGAFVLQSRFDPDKKTMVQPGDEVEVRDSRSSSWKLGVVERFADGDIGWQLPLVALFDGPEPARAWPYMRPVGGGGGARASSLLGTEIVVSRVMVEVPADSGQEPEHVTKLVFQQDGEALKRAAVHALWQGDVAPGVDESQLWNRWPKDDDETALVFHPRLHAHQEFELEADVFNQQARNVVFNQQVYFSTHEMCGAGLFTQTELTCSSVDSASRTFIFEFVKNVPQRAFGVELELVARTPSTTQTMQWQKVNAYWSRTEPASGMAPSERLIEEQNQSVQTFWTGLDQDQQKEIEYQARELIGIEGIETCFAEAKRGQSFGSCETDIDCPLSHYCMSCEHGVHLPFVLDDDALQSLGPSPYATIPDRCAALADAGSGSRMCLPRRLCHPELAVSGRCPVPLALWTWESDSTVKTLTDDQIKAVGLDGDRARLEEGGIAFELKSPAPPVALVGRSGLESLAETIAVLRSMGVQAGPSAGLHVHVNVGKPGEPSTHTSENGADLSYAQVANVWANYARFQFVIDEMLQDNRVNSQWSRGLRFEKWLLNGTSSPHLVEVDPNFGVSPKNIFENLHMWLRRVAPKDPLKFCDFIFTGMLYPDHPVCNDQLANERYMSVNLLTLNRLGTIEFRAQAATHDPERLLMWTRFVLWFVEIYKDDGRYFSGPTMEDDFERLVSDQRSASLDQLEEGLDMDLDFFRRRPWLRSPACGPVPCEAACQARARETESKSAELLKGLRTASRSQHKLDVRLDEPDSPPRDARLRRALHSRRASQ